ncbi:hypothetical protein BEN43_18955 [Leptospira interrogans serovar Bataviae]|nr:hypothetical protein [Leptospira interrogans serovar Bataviae]
MFSEVLYIRVVEKLIRHRFPLYGNCPIEVVLLNSTIEFFNNSIQYFAIYYLNLKFHSKILRNIFIHIFLGFIYILFSI